MLHPLFSRRFLAINQLASGDSGSAQAQELRGEVTFHYTGQPQKFDVPPNVFQLNIKVAGACGGPANNGGAAAKGGISSGILSVSPGQTLWVYVGGHGSR